jgi:hypothetical protein
MHKIAILSVLIAGLTSPAVAKQSPQIAANEMVVRQWAKSGVRWQCAPLGITPAMAGGATPRPADFSDGWSVAFDRNDLRSAYGIAGTGIRDAHMVSHEERTRRLSLQWPLVKQLQFGRQLAVAGYGIEGAKPYSAENPDGVGESSLAYVYVGGQSCLYNVWSKLGRQHLEKLLTNLFIIPMSTKPR